jgi:hypothetical protein
MMPRALGGFSRIRLDSWLDVHPLHGRNDDAIGTFGQRKKMTACIAEVEKQLADYVRKRGG